MKTIAPKVGEPQKKKVAIGAAGVSLFLHLGLLLLVGGVVVVEYAVPRSSMTGELTPVLTEESAAPTDETPEALGEPESPETPTEMAAPASAAAPENLQSAAIDLISVNAPIPAFQLPAAGGLTVGTGLAPGPGGETLGTGKPSKPGKVSNPFGGGEKTTGSAFEGVLYDLKQGRDRKRSGVTATSYFDVLREFLSKNWNKNVLKDYYRVQKPLYTSQIYMPLMGAEAAPKAFQVEKDVMPSLWIVLYEGSFQAPEAGQYRLAGYADDVLVVRVDDRTVLDGSRVSTGYDTKISIDPLVKVSHSEVNRAHRVGNGSLTYSEWMQFEPGQAHKIEILLGERPGGQFCAFLFVEQKNRNYTKDAGGRPLLPIFRTADMEVVPDRTAPFAPDGPIFGGP